MLSQQQRAVKLLGVAMALCVALALGVSDKSDQATTANLATDDNFDEGKVRHLAFLKKQATHKAKDVLDMEGTLARLVAENAKHASAVPSDYSIQRRLGKRAKFGLDTQSTSHKWMEEQNTKMLEKERLEMEKKLAADHNTRKAAALKARVDSVITKLETSHSKKMKEQAHKKRQEAMLHHMSKLARIKKLRDTAVKNAGLVARYHQLKAYRRKMKLTTEGKVQKVGKVSTEDMVEKVSGGKPAKITSKAGAKPGIAAVPGATAAVSKPAAKELAKVDLPKMGPTHRRRNPPSGQGGS